MLKPVGYCESSALTEDYRFKCPHWKEGGFYIHSLTQYLKEIQTVEETTTQGNRKKEIIKIRIEVKQK